MRHHIDLVAAVALVVATLLVASTAFARIPAPQNAPVQPISAGE